MLGCPLAVGLGGVVGLGGSHGHQALQGLEGSHDDRVGAGWGGGGRRILIHRIRKGSGWDNIGNS